MTALSLISNWDRIARVCMCPSICNKAAVICLTIGKQNELGGNRAYSRKESDKILVTADFRIGIVPRGNLVTDGGTVTNWYLVSVFSLPEGAAGLARST